MGREASIIDLQVTVNKGDPAMPNGLATKAFSFQIYKAGLEDGNTGEGSMEGERNGDDDARKNRNNGSENGPQWR
jgi:hypothetical protein